MSHTYACGRNESTAMIDHLLLRSSQLINHSIQFSLKAAYINMYITSISGSFLDHQSCIYGPISFNSPDAYSSPSLPRVPLCSKCQPSMFSDLSHIFSLINSMAFFPLNNIHIIDLKIFSCLAMIFPKIFLIKLESPQNFENCNTYPTKIMNLWISPKF